MKHKFLQIAGVDNEEAFYKKYPSEAAFFKAHPEAMGKQKKWKKGADGLTIPTKDTNPYYGTDRPFDTGEPLDPKTALRNQMFLNTELPNEDPTLRKLQPFQMPIPSSKDLRAPRVTLPYSQGVKLLDKPKDKKPYSPNLSNGIAAGLSLIDAAIPKGDMSRKYVRPEDQLSYNPLPYGTGSQAIMKKGGKMKKCPDGGTISVDQNFLRTTGRGRPALNDLNSRKDKFLNSTPMSSLEHWDGIQGNNSPAPTERQWWDNNLNYMINNNMNSNNYHDRKSHYSITPTNIPVPNDTPTFAEMGATIPGLAGQFYARESGLKSKKAKKGLTIMSYADGGGVTPLIGGKAPQISHNPVDGGMGEFQGRSHEDGGIKATFAGKPFEAEGGEPYRIDNQGSLEIFGQLKNPLTGSTFKKDAKVIAKKEQKVQKYIDAGTELVNSTPKSKDMFEVMKMNSGQAMMKGGLAKQKELADAKEHLSTLQDMMLQVTSPDKAANGAKYPDGEKPYPEIPLVDISMPSYLDKFETVKEKTKAALEAKYPGKKIEVKYNALGSARSAKQQQGIKANQKSSLSKDWSTHNWDAGRDYNIFIDGKLQNTTSPDYKILHSIGSQEGLHYLKGNAAKKDPFHLSLVEEGGPNTAANLLKAYPDLAKNPAVQSWAHEITKMPGFDEGTVPKNIEKAYNASLNAGVRPRTYEKIGEVQDLVIPKGQSIQGEGLYPTSNYWSPDSKWNFNGTKPTTNSPAPVTDVHKPFNFTNPLAQNLQDLKSPFPWEQTIPLIPALIDRTDPVKMQKFSPDLYSPYSVSFQDQRNRNTAQLRGVQTATAYDPTAQAVLGAQAYSANNQIDAEEFRTNQGIFNDVLNKNVSLLNAAKTANLQLGDTQYTRQTQAQANTRDRRTEGLVALTDLIAKNQLENKTLGVAKNLFKDYTFDKNGTLKYVGADINERMAGVPTGTATQKTKSEVTTKTGNTTTKDTYQLFDAFNKPLKDYTKDITNSLKFNPNKAKGGKITQNTIAKLMYS